MPYVTVYLFRAAADTTKRILFVGARSKHVRIQIVQIRPYITEIGCSDLLPRELRSSERTEVRTLHPKSRYCYLGTYEHMVIALDMNTSRRFSFGYPFLPQPSSTFRNSMVRGHPLTHILIRYSISAFQTPSLCRLT